MEMETRAREEIGVSEDITHHLPPLAFALHDLLLSSRCSACFAAVNTAVTSPNVVYCSAECSVADSSLHFSSAEHQLFLLQHDSSWSHGESSDLRAALRLLHRLELLNLLTPVPQLPGRIAGLMTNRDRLISSKDEDDLAMIKDGARAMAMARAMRDEREFDGDCELEEAVMCIVLTNAVEVQIGREKPLGIAVYDGRFSWINHCCSPNACYRFKLCSGDLQSSNSGSSRIGPANQGIQIEDDSVNDMCELAGECISNGPRLVVRCIKMMKKGDEVTVTYTDLLQPRMLRQSDLWCKYRFLCNCIRCTGALSYVDHSLQETLPVDINPDRRDGFSEEMRHYFDTVISDYMSTGNAKSCCEKIENLLIQKPTDLQLSPIHHLSLSAYTALSSAYRIQSSFMKNTSKSFSLIRISTAYSLLLAGATHHLFNSEPSLITSAANFWISAGESLVSFAQSSNKFKAVAEHEELNKVTQHFLNCIARIVPEVWSFLVQDCCYLAQIEDPIDFSWLEPLRTSNVWRCRTKSIANGLNDEVRKNTFLLGAHCLVYGSYLSGICYGEDSSAAKYAKNILQG